MKHYADISEEEFKKLYGCKRCDYVPLVWGDPQVLMFDRIAHQLEHMNEQLTPIYTTGGTPVDPADAIKHQGPYGFGGRVGSY